MSITITADQLQRAAKLINAWRPEGAITLEQTADDVTVTCGTHSFDVPADPNGPIYRTGSKP